MPTIEGYQDHHIKRRRIAWLPDAPLILMYLVVSLFLLLLFARQSIFAWIGGESLQTLGGFEFITQGENYYLDALFAIPILGTLSVIIFWAAIGCSLYCLVWGLTNTVKEAQKYEHAANDSVLPKGYDKKRFWEGTAANIILMISSLCVLLFLVIFSFAFALPAAEQLLVTLLVTPLSLNGLWALLILIVGAILFGHSIYLSLHAFNYARRVVFF